MGGGRIRASNYCGRSSPPSSESLPFQQTCLNALGGIEVPEGTSGGRSCAQAPSMLASHTVPSGTRRPPPATFRLGCEARSVVAPPSPPPDGPQRRARQLS